MTRAKPKPTISTREPAKKQRTEPATPAKSAPAKAVPVKGAALKSALGNVPSKPAATKAAPAVKATPSKPAATKAAPAAKATPSKPAATKAAPAAKAAPRKPAATKAAPAAKAAPALKAAAAKANSTKALAGKLAPSLDTPAKIRPIEQAVGVSSDAVARRTGKSWAEWFALLDAAGAAELDHKGIVAVLAQRHGVGPWWQQMVTVAYEQARGKNGNTATDDGFQVDVSKVLELPLAKLFRFWAEPAERNKWLADDRFSIHKATASKSIRARWGRGVSRIDVDFCEKGPSKSQVTVQHNRIETSDAAEQMKAYWAKKIRALEALTRP
ncbi:MAG TPA: hypothetical protein VGJ91_15145 [Polyangiaceae bacterium]